MKIGKIPSVLINIILLIIVILGFSQPAHASYSGPPRVRFIYLVPKDKEFGENYRKAIENAALDIQKWYGQSMGTGKTFTLSNPIVETYKTSHNAAYYVSDPGTQGLDKDGNRKLGKDDWFYWNTVRDGLPLVDGSFNDPLNRYVFFIDADDPKAVFAGGTVTGTIGSDNFMKSSGQGVAVIFPGALTGLVRKMGDPNYGNPSTNPYKGTIAHELGHAFQLRHTLEVGYRFALMENYVITKHNAANDFPDCQLLDDEIQKLSASPFFNHDYHGGGENFAEHARLLTEIRNLYEKFAYPTRGLEADFLAVYPTNAADVFEWEIEQLRMLVDVISTYEKSAGNKNTRHFVDAEYLKLAVDANFKDAIQAIFIDIKAAYLSKEPVNPPSVEEIRIHWNAYKGETPMQNEIIEFIDGVFDKAESFQDTGSHRLVSLKRGRVLSNLLWGKLNSIIEKFPEREMILKQQLALLKKKIEDPLLTAGLRKMDLGSLIADGGIGSKISDPAEHKESHLTSELIPEPYTDIKEGKKILYFPSWKGTSWWWDTQTDMFAHNYGSGTPKNTIPPGPSVFLTEPRVTLGDLTTFTLQIPPGIDELMIDDDWKGATRYPFPGSAWASWVTAQHSVYTKGLVWVPETKTYRNTTPLIKVRSLVPFPDRKSLSFTWRGDGGALKLNQRPSPLELVDNNMRPTDIKYLKYYNEQGRIDKVMYEGEARAIFKAIRRTEDWQFVKYQIGGSLTGYITNQSMDHDGARWGKNSAGGVDIHGVGHYIVMDPYSQLKMSVEGASNNNIVKMKRFEDGEIYPKVEVQVALDESKLPADVIANEPVRVWSDVKGADSTVVTKRTIENQNNPTSKDDLGDSGDPFTVRASDPRKITVALANPNDSTQKDRFKVHVMARALQYPSDPYEVIVDYDILKAELEPNLIDDGKNSQVPGRGVTEIKATVKDESNTGVPDIQVKWNLFRFESNNESSSAENLPVEYSLDGSNFTAWNGSADLLGKVPTDASGVAKIYIRHPRTIENISANIPLIQAHFILKESGAQPKATVQRGIYLPVKIDDEIKLTDEQIQELSEAFASQALVGADVGSQMGKKESAPSTSPAQPEVSVAEAVESADSSSGGEPGVAAIINHSTSSNNSTSVQSASEGTMTASARLHTTPDPVNAAAEKERLAQEAGKAEELQKQAEAEQARIAAEAQALEAEKARMAAEKLADDERIAAEKAADDERIAKEMAANENRIAEENAMVAAQTVQEAEVQRQAGLIAQELKAQDDQRIAGEVAANDKRIAEEAATNEKRIADEKAADDKRIADEMAANERRIAAETAAAQAAQDAETQRQAELKAAEEARQVAEKEARRIANEQEGLEKERLAHEAAKAEELQKQAEVEQARIAAEVQALKAQEIKNAAEDQVAENKRIADEQERLEKERIAQEAYKAEELRKEAAIEQARITAEAKALEAEKVRVAAEKAVDDKRIADEAAANEKRIAEETAANEKRIADEKLANDKRIADEVAANEKRSADEKAATEKERAFEAAKAEELQKQAEMEQARVAAEVKALEALRIKVAADAKAKAAEEVREVAEAQRLADEKATAEKAEAKRIAEEKAAAELKAQEAKRLEEEQVALEAKRAAEAKAVAEEAEAKRIANEQERLEKERIAQEAYKAEELRKEAAIEQARIAAEAKALEAEKEKEAKRLADEQAAAAAQAAQDAEVQRQPELKAQELKIQDDKRIAEETATNEKRIAADAKAKAKAAELARDVAEAQRLADEKAAAVVIAVEEAAKAEAVRVATEVRKAEETRSQAESKKEAELKVAEDTRKDEQARQAEESRKSTEREQAKIAAEAKGAKEALGIAEATKVVEVQAPVVPKIELPVVVAPIPALLPVVAVPVLTPGHISQAPVIKPVVIEVNKEMMKQTGNAIAFTKDAMPAVMKTTMDNIARVQAGEVVDASQKLTVSTTRGKDISLTFAQLAEFQKGDEFQFPIKLFKEAGHRPGDSYQVTLKTHDAKKAQWTGEMPIAKVDMMAINGAEGSILKNGGALSEKVIVLVSNDKGLDTDYVTVTVDGKPVSARVTGVNSSSIKKAMSTQSIVPTAAVEIDIPKEIAQAIGSHEIKIQIEDVAGNRGTLEITGLKVQEAELRITDTPRNFPNPFSIIRDKQTAIIYTLSKDADITIIFYDLTGQMIARKNIMANTVGGRVGLNEVPWEGRSDYGYDVGNGVYSYMILSQGKILGRGQLSVFR